MSEPDPKSKIEPETRNATINVSILFVCMGNICRSPTGEGVMRKLVEDRGMIDRVVVDSAGTIGYHQGHPADTRMRKHAAKRGYNLTSVARQIQPGDLDRFDLIIAMDSANHHDILGIARGQTNHVRLLSNFLDGDWPTDVPDPYYGGDEGFETVIDMIEAACLSLLDYLLTDMPKASSKS